MSVRSANNRPNIKEAKTFYKTDWISFQDIFPRRLHLFSHRLTQEREEESISFLLFPFFPLSCALYHSWFYFGHSIAFFISFTKGTQIRNPAHSNMSCNCSSPKLKFKQMPFFIHTHTERDALTRPASIQSNISNSGLNNSTLAIVTKLLLNNAPEYFHSHFYTDGPAITYRFNTENVW